MRAALLLVLAGCGIHDVRAIGNRVRTGACENRIHHDGRTAVIRYEDGVNLTSYREIHEDGVVGFTLTRTYDERGRRVRQEVDTGHDEPARHRWATWAYDDHDRIVRVDTAFGDDIGWTEIVYRPDGLRDRTIDDDGRVTRYEYRGGDPLVIDELHDGWGWRYTFARGRWLTRLDNLDADGNPSLPSIYTYGDLDRGELVRRDFWVRDDGTVEEVDHYTWEDGRLVRVTYGDQVIDLDHDWRGRIVERRHRGDGFDWTTEIEWAGDTPSRVERRDTATGERLEAWTIERGCSREREKTIRLAGVNDWEEALETIDPGIDRRAYWRDFEVM